MSKKRYPSYHVEACDTLQYLFKIKKINDHTLHFVATFLKQLDLSRMRQAVDIAMNAFPLIRCNFNEKIGRSCWQEKDYTSDEIVTLIESENSDKNIIDFICREVDSLTGTQLKIQIVRSVKIDTLCIVISHMLCDAAGFKDFLYLLSSIYTHIEVNSAYPPLEAMKDRKIRQLMKSFSIKDKMKIYFSKNGISPHDSTKLPFEGNLNTPFIEMRTIPFDQFCALKIYAKSHNATINDLMLTAFHRILFQMFGHVVTIPCANDLRKYLISKKAEGICNLVTNINCDIGKDLGATFEDTLIKVKSAMNNEKTDIRCIKSLALMDLIFNILPYHIAKNIINRSFTNPPIAFTNIGILDKKQLVFGAAQMTGAYMTGSIKYTPYFQLALSTYDNEATLSINLYGTQADREQISTFLDKFIQELQSRM